MKNGSHTSSFTEWWICLVAKYSSYEMVEVEFSSSSLLHRSTTIFESAIVYEKQRSKSCATKIRRKTFHKVLWLGKKDWFQMNYIQIFGSISSMLTLNSNLVEIEQKTKEKQAKVAKTASKWLSSMWLSHAPRNVTARFFDCRPLPFPVDGNAVDGNLAAISKNVARFWRQKKWRATRAYKHHGGLNAHCRISVVVLQGS